MHVALATDRAYLPWCATAILSCLEANRPQVVHVHVLHLGDLTADDAGRLEAMVREQGSKLELHAIDPASLSSLPSKGEQLGGHISWARVALGDALAELERVLYLDADVLVVGPTTELWELPLGDADLAAVPNVVEPAMRPHVRSLGIAVGTHYFNAGVLLIDLTRWREQGWGDALSEVALNRAGALPWFDQDALNVVFAGRWKELAPRWNAQNSLWSWPRWAEEVFGAEVILQATTQPAILHFEGPSLNKPWHYLCQHPWRDEYRRTTARTPWAGSPLEDRTPATAVIARLPTRRRIPAYLRLQRFRSQALRSRRRLAARLFP